MTSKMSLIRDSYYKMIEQEILSVQPMDEARVALEFLIKDSMSEKDLIEEGYKPACDHSRLIWIKDNKQ